MTAHLTLAENVALMAGAGTGKTHNLVTVCLHQLGGANRSGEPLACGRMWAVTFTDKAAAEMKERLRAHLLRLAAGERMPELGASYGALGRTAPPATFWAQVLADLPTANVGTFHSLCAQLLRRYAAETGIDPAFVTLEEAEARELFFRAAEQQIVADLDLGGDAAAEARRCCIAFGLYAPGAHGLGLVDLCERVHAQVREDGRDLAWLVANAGDLPSATAAFEAAREAALTAVAAARGLGGNLRVVDGAAACAAVLPVLDALRLDTFTDRRDAIDRAIGAIHLQHLDRPSREALKAARESLEGLPEAYADAAAAPLARAFAAVLARAAEAYEREKRRHAALDFTDLLGRARDLLRDHPAVRREVQARVGAIVVDEFQDTNAVQLDLMALWCERRDGAARPVPRERRAAELLPLEPAMLAVVGDRKQSIYDFRGADVAIFSELAERFRKGDGRVEHLQHNRRSVAALLLLANRLFARAMAPAEEPLPFQVSYTPKDDLVAMRTGAPAGPRAELLRLPPADDIPAGAEPVRVQKGPDERVDREADAVARRVAAMVAGDGTTVEDPSGTWRAVRGGDVAILLRRFVHLDAFRRALLANRIPHVVVHGRGFYGSQEVLDLSNLLAAVGDPGDALATAAVLRSPLVAVTDSTLLRLAVSAGRAPTFGAMLHSAWRVPENTPAEDAARLSRFLDLYRGLVREADRLGAAGVLELALDGFDYVAVISAGFQGEQRAANVAKLLARARVHDGSGAGGVGRLARELAELADREPREGQAPVLEEADPNVVRVMTVHQAKGLEFPVVFVPECGAGERPENRALLIDRDLGIAVKPRDLGERGLAGRRYREVAGRRRARERAEAVRLFYVAATRARDYLVFSGE